MIKWFGNYVIYGWYYETSEGFTYGDGTYSTAQQIQENYEGVNKKSKQSYK